MAPDLRRREGLPPPHTPEEARQIWDEIEHGRWLGLLPWVDVVRHLPERLAHYVEDWLGEPARPPWHFDEVHQEVEVPNLDFSGWYDHCNGTMAHLGLMQRNGRTELAREQTKLIIGPWNHPGLGQRRIGDIDFGPAAHLDLTDLIIRFFDRWVKGIENEVDAEPPVRYFTMGTGEWKQAETWPPEGLREAVYYLHSGGRAQGVAGDGRLDEMEPGDEREDHYRYDPQDPVPTLWTRDLFTVPADRRQLGHRRDILCYRSEPLVQEVEVVGYPSFVLFAASSAPDTDFFARLVDEDPEGQALEICYGMVRARHRNGLEREDLIEPGAVIEYRISLGATAICFQVGHRIRLEVTSSDFPNHDRNHNTGRNDLVDAEFIVAEQQVHHSASYASRLLLPIAPR